MPPKTSTDINLVYLPTTGNSLTVDNSYYNEYREFIDYCIYDIKAIRRLAADLGYYVAKRPVRKEASKDE